MQRALDDRTVCRYRDEEFPITRKLVHLNHASIAPTSVRAAEAVARWLGALAEEADDEVAWEAGVERCRERFATLLGCAAGEVAFVRNTSHGLSLVAEGVPWRAGDRIAVATAVEYPSNVHPWKRKAAELGGELIELPHRGGALDLDRIADVLAAGPRLVAVSSAQYATGAVTDLVALGRMCREHGVLFCVDAIQTVGALPVDVREAGIDFLTADSHKWMLGMPGMGVLFVAADRVRDMRPALLGWKSMVDGWEFDSRFDTLLPDAGRFEEGTPAYALIEGLSAAVELLLEVSIEAIAARVSRLTERLAGGLETLGCAVGPAPPWRRHIVSFTHPEIALDTAAADLGRRGIVVSERGAGIRAAPHFYNTEAEIDRLVDAVRDLIS